MFQSIKSPSPHNKKLFEWNAEKRELALAKDKKLYLCELAEDFTFICISERDKPPHRKSKNRISR